MLIKSLKELHESLLALVEAPNQKEEHYQKWFENNRMIFSVLGFSEEIPHPCSINIEGEEYIPDFLARDCSGSWFVFELKRPDIKVHKQRNRRRTFYRDFESYISQCNEYSLFFEETDNRNFMKTKYGITVQRQVHSILVASRDDSLDKHWVHDEIVRNRNSRITLLTFDDILSSIENQIRLQESPLLHLQGVSGAVLFSHFDPITTPQDQYLLDFGSDPMNKVSVGFNANSVFVYITIKGKCVSTRRPFLFVLGNKPNLLYFRVGLSDSCTHISLSMNGTESIDRVFDPMHIKTESIHNIVCGSDVMMKTPASSIMYEVIVYACILDHKEKEQLLSYFNQRYQYYLSPLAIHPLPGILFDGLKSLYTPGHPFSTDKKISGKSILSNKMLGWYDAAGGNLTLSDGSTPLPAPYLAQPKAMPPYSSN